MPNTTETEAIAQNLIRAFMQFKRIRMGRDDLPLPPGHLHPGLKHSEVSLLFALREAEAEHPKGVSVSDISSYLRVKPPSITHSIAGLEQKNMLERCMDESDRRIIRIRLKENGRKFTDAAMRHLVHHIMELVEYLGPEKCKTLADLINESFAFISSRNRRKPF